MSTLFTLASSVAGAWGTAVELLPLLAIHAAVRGLRVTFELLDHAAAAARYVYAAGRFCGRLWYRYAQPAFLAAADFISAVLAEIDWQKVASTINHGLRFVVAMCIASAAYLHEAVICISAMMVGSTTASVVTKAKDPGRRTRRQGRLWLGFA